MYRNDSIEVSILRFQLLSFTLKTPHSDNPQPTSGQLSANNNFTTQHSEVPNIFQQKRFLEMTYLDSER